MDQQRPMIVMIFFRIETKEIVIRTTDVQLNITLDAILPVNEAMQFIKEMKRGIETINEGSTLH
jgi:hypothetical protein